MSNWTTADIPDQSGRIAVITGANTGLGYETAAALAARGAHVVLAVRNVEKGKQAAARIGGDVSVVELDLTSLASVRTAADEIKSRFDHLDLLINNAGVMTTPKSTTVDGFELQFGTNHLGHFAFTGLLVDHLADVPGARVVTVSSNGHKMLADIHFDDLQWEHGYNRMRAYSQSKLANLLFTYELQRRLADGHAAVAVAAHPGFSSTELGRNLPNVLQPVVKAFSPLLGQSAAMGALPTLRAAADPGALGGQYFGPDGFAEQRGYPKVVPSSDQSHDLALQRRLWTVSEELTGVTFPV
ncbi:SDR family NAD(P)-dependent oxidoreductase [Mycolicibacterium sp. P1-18]|uniref:SDR family NAD(P)-dependent oxidoreductase n=1 Tax=Mycolicibacterium sp. P1-18 TaxID=2024615 RepID=UPI0011F396A3|nr:SDR family NAD(P)-dependent oxidoreductase [Mycolicibacterium sp. P1-18]KAA0101969.1 SDR family NAD(P)-dependent oxidoreductase [Mycolicibacterium sp. P1-18]